MVHSKYIRGPGTPSKMKGKLCGPQEPIALLGLPPSPAPHCQMQFLSLPWMPKVGQDSSYRHLSKSKEGSDYEENQPLPLPLFHSGCRYHSPKSLKKYIKIIPTSFFLKRKLLNSAEDIPITMKSILHSCA